MWCLEGTSPKDAQQPKEAQDQQHFWSCQRGLALLPAGVPIAGSEGMDDEL